MDEVVIEDVPGTLSRRYFYAALTLFICSWWIFSGVQYYASILDARLTGPNEDVVDSLRRSNYVSRRAFPFIVFYLTLDFLAFLAIARDSESGKQCWYARVLFLLIVLTLGFHSLICFCAGFFM